MNAKKAHKSKSVKQGKMKEENEENKEGNVMIESKKNKTGKNIYFEKEFSKIHQ